jgi:hypothetical protein
MKRRFDSDRFRELILYLVFEGEADPTLGAVKLNKLLYYADRRAYLQLGRSITGARYQHLDEGPAPTALLPAKRQLIADKDVVPIIGWYVSHPQERLVAKRKPNMGRFSQAELDIVDAVLNDLRDMNGDDVSKLSHKEWGWRLTADREEIPERTAWLAPGPLTADQIENGQRIWNEYLASKPAL